MVTGHDDNLKSGQPDLSELFKQYLLRQASARAAGLGMVEPPEVSLHDAAPAQPVDPRLAWHDALAVLQCFKPEINAQSCSVPPDWPPLVAGHEPVVSLAFAVGNFPQLVRNLQPLWHSDNLTALRPTNFRAAAQSSLAEWASETARKGQFPQTIVALGTLRLGKQFAAAKDLVKKHQSQVPAAWQGAWANEEAALAWHDGRSDEAAVIWQNQAESTPVLFNRGMATLFLGKPADARSSLTRAVSSLPEDNAWHHLGRLYLALAEMRS